MCYTHRTGTGDIIFGYNGRDGVVTDTNGLCYMRARYYSPDMRRFINADIIAGKISNAVTLNRYAYANGNPVSNVDPFGLSAERDSTFDSVSSWLDLLNYAPAFVEGADWLRNKIYWHKYNRILSSKKPRRIPKGSWILKNSRKLAHLDDAIGSTSNIAKGISSISKVLDVVGDVASVFSIIGDASAGFVENIENGTEPQRVISDFFVDLGIGTIITAGSSSIGALVGSFIPVPVVGTLVGAGVGYIVGEGANWLANEKIGMLGNKSFVEAAKDDFDIFVDTIVEMTEATKDFIKDTGDFIKDTGKAIGSFFESTSNAVGGFFSELFA